MALDGAFLYAVRQEMNCLIGARVEKIHQPAREEIIISMRTREGSYKVMISASADRARVHLTEVQPENPKVPPMFCMLLRKHLSGGRISAVTQPPLERMVKLTLDCTDEMGEPVQKQLILELMGRNSNLILLGSDGRIIDCIRRVDFEQSEKRQLLPGLFYQDPPAIGKADPTTETADVIVSRLEGVPSPCPMDKWLLDTYGGMSPLLCRELAFSLLGETDADLSILSPETRQSLASAMAEAFASLKEASCATLLRKDGKPTEFSFRPISQYGEYLQTETYESFSALLDSFYTDRDHADRMRQKTQTLHKTVSTLRDRTARKLEIQRKELSATLDRERLRQLGDIVTANLHAIARGQTSLTVQDFYDPDMAQITIALSPQLSPQQNAAKFYKDYNRAKTAQKMLTEQIALGEQELEYLYSVLEELSRAETEKDVAEIRAELIAGGYVRDTEKRKAMKSAPAKPMEFRSSEGFPIRVGRNNRQNDELTLKQSQKGDLWLHVQKLPGSHVVIQCAGEQPGDDTITEAAMLAVWYSQARNSHQVPVDVTPVKQIKKPAGAKPGMVIYHQYRTVYVTAEEPVIKQLKGEA